MTAIIDYDAGNVRSVLNAMKSLGEEAVLTSDPEEILGADHVIIPGEGAFGMAMEKIRQRRLEEVILEVAASGTPFLGICIGQQLLFDASEESPGVKGLGILHGTCRKIKAPAEPRKRPRDNLFNLLAQFASAPDLHLFCVAPLTGWRYFGKISFILFLTTRWKDETR